MTTKSEREVPELVRAAEALESELARLETLARSLGKIRLDSEKDISKAAKELNEALAVPERLASGLQTLASAMAEMQSRQQLALESLATRATHIQQRVDKLGAHMQAFAALGKAAAQITARLQSEPTDGSAVLDGVDAALTHITEGARSLFDAARADGFTDVAREAEALKQRVSALRKRLERKN
jgi:hypothetical protein